MPKKKEKVEETSKEKVEAKEEAVETPETPEVVVSEAPIAVTPEVALDEEEYLKKTAATVHSFDQLAWTPKTELGKKTKKGELIDIDEILDRGDQIKEAEIVDYLLPGIESDFLMIGQSKGKFGGGKRKIFRQTQKKTKEGNKPHFEIMAVVGNKNGYVGMGYGKSKETVPSREKSLRNAKLNIIKIRRGCGSWQCGCKEPHSIPYTVNAKCGSVHLKLMPAPKGTGLKVEKECAKMLALAGIKDVWGEARGKAATKTNLVHACFDAMKKLTQMKTQEKHTAELGLIEGKLQ